MAEVSVDSATTVEHHRRAVRRSGQPSGRLLGGVLEGSAERRAPEEKIAAVPHRSRVPWLAKEPRASGETSRGDPAGRDPSNVAASTGTTSVNKLVRVRNTYWAVAADAEEVLPRSTMRPSAHHPVAARAVVAGTTSGKGVRTIRTMRMATATNRPSTATPVRRSSGVIGQSCAAHSCADDPPQLSGTTASTAVVTPNTA